MVATTSGADLVLTAKEFEQSFSTSVSGEIEGATVAATTTPSAGSGSGAQVVELEQSALPAMYGEYYQDSGILGRKEDPPAFADPSKNYTVYTIRYDNGPAYDQVVRTARFSDIFVCVATTGVTGDLDAFFGTA